jgi:hypothetical protein
MMNWRETCDHMDKLVAADAPALIKAHCLVRLLLPKLMAQIGIRECSAELASLFANGLCVQTATCSICCKTRVDGDDGLCCRCRADVDQLCAEAGL